MDKDMNAKLCEDVVNLLPEAKGRTLKNLKYRNSSLFNNVMNQTAYLNEGTNLAVRLVFLRDNLTNLPNCKICGIQHQHTINRANIVSISEYCSKECFNKDTAATKHRASKVNQVEKMKKQNATMLKKYGVEYSFQRPEVKSKISESKIKDVNITAYSALTDKDWMYDQYIVNKRHLTSIADELNVYYGTVGDYCRQHGFDIRQHTTYSSHEILIREWLDSLNISNVGSSHPFDTNHEVDILIENRVGVEINGIYYHSYNSPETKPQKYKHYNKMVMAKNIGIKLLQFTDEQIVNKLDIVKSIILNKIGKTPNKIYARKCVVVKVNNKDAKHFYETNHIQGYRPSKVHLGLEIYGELVCVMSFSKPRFDKVTDWELIRLSTKLNTVVVGGASKIFSHFIETYCPVSIKSYADLCFGEGKVYEALGFKYEGETGIGYHWTDNRQLFNRMKFQKHKLKDILPIFNNDLSEAENMFANKYRRYWDCGHNIWVWSQEKAQN